MSKRAFFFLCALPLWGDIHFDNAALCGFADSGILSCSYTVGSGGNPALFIGVYSSTGAAPSAVSFGGTPLSLVTSNGRYWLYALFGGPVGTQTVRISASRAQVYASISSYAGVAASGVVQVTTGSAQLGSGCPSAPGLSIPLQTKYANDWVIETGGTRTAAPLYFATAPTMVRAAAANPGAGVTMLDSAAAAAPGVLTLGAASCDEGSAIATGLAAEIQPAALSATQAPATASAQGPATSYSAVSEVITPGWTPMTFPLPSLPPAMGATAGSTLVDTSIPTNATLMRITTPDDSRTGNSLVAPALGDRNVWSTDGTHALYLDNYDGVWHLLTLNLANWPDGSTIVSKSGGLPIVAAYFSYTNPNVIYGVIPADTNLVVSYDWTTGTTSTILDMSVLNGWNSAAGIGEFAVSGDDRWFCGSNGGQNSAWLVGCFDSWTGNTYALDTNANTVTINNGTPNPVTGAMWPGGMTTPGNGIHEIEFGNSGRYLSVQAEIQPFTYWDLLSANATLLINETVDSSNHLALGYLFAARGAGGQCPKVDGSDARAFTLRPYANYNLPVTWVDLDECVPAGMQSWDDEDHFTWSNGAGAAPAMQDKYPVFANITMHAPHWPQQWLDDELVAFETDGAQETAWHFFHNYTSYADSGCPAYLVSPHVSRDGRWVLFNSDWMGTLGAGAPGDCANRMDVFLAKLQ